ncbi:unnamed protein product [Effrenium voratum]|nr:unnamed protein product [Effrenium voratum]
MVGYFRNSVERDSTVHMRADPWPRFTMKEYLLENGLLPGVICKYGPNRKVTFNKAEMEKIAFDEEQGHLSNLFKGRLFRLHVGRWIEECIVKDVATHPVDQELMFVRFERHIPGKMTVVPIPVSISGLWGCPGYRKGGQVEIGLPTVKCEVVGDHIPPPFVVDVSNLHLENPFGKITLRQLQPLLPKDGTVRFAREYSLDEEVVTCYDPKVLGETPLPHDWQDPNFIHRGSHLNSGQRRRTETLRRVHEKAEEGRSTRRLSLEMLQGEPSGTSEQEGNPDMHTSVEEELTWQQALLLLLEEPSYGLMARLISYLMILAICGSIATFVMESEPTLEDWEGWFILEAISTAIFTVEYLLRLAVCNAFGSPTRLEFIRTTMNVVDVIAILPFFLELITRSLEVSGPLAVLRVLRLVRIFRIFRLSRYSLGMSVMISSLAASIQPLIILVFFLCIGGTLFSSLMYYAERMYCPDMEKITPEEFLIHQQECKDASWDSKGQRCCDEFGAAKEFTSIMECVVTMTTVGYGDKVPATKLGQFVGGMTILSGIVLISLPVAIVGSRFQRAYEEKPNWSSRGPSWTRGTARPWKSCWPPRRIARKGPAARRI